MGTNFEIETNICPVCGRPEQKLHIGKLSAGWVFQLHVIPELGINDLEDWKRVFRTGTVRITDEYGESATIEEMETYITEGVKYKHAVVDGYRILANCDGYDLQVGEFS